MNFSLVNCTCHSMYHGAVRRVQLRHVGDIRGGPDPGLLGKSNGTGHSQISVQLAKA